MAAMDMRVDKFLFLDHLLLGHIKQQTVIRNLGMAKRIALQGITGTKPGDGLRASPGPVGAPVYM